MKKLLLLLLLQSIVSLAALAQDNKNFAAALMTKRDLTCDDIDYNVAILVPKMYLENKIDTLDAIITYWEKNCDISEPAVSFSILYSIKQNTFNRQIKGIHTGSFTDAAIADTGYFNRNIVATLVSYKSTFDKRQPNSNMLSDAERAYRDYYDLLYDMAVSLKKATDLSPLENFFMRFYSNPDSTSMDELSARNYDSSSIQRVYINHTKYTSSLSGGDYALVAGAWIPQGNLSVLTTSPYLGFLLGGKRNKWTIDFDCYLNFPLSHTQTYQVSNHDSLSPSNTYLGFYSGIDVGFQLFHRNKSEMDVLGTVALQGLYVLNGNNGSANLTLVSADPNLGIGYKFYFKHRVTYNTSGYLVKNSYIGIQAKYNLLYFNNFPGTSLSGNAITIGIIYGGTTKERKYYDENIPFGDR